MDCIRNHSSQGRSFRFLWCFLATVVTMSIATCDAVGGGDGHSYDSGEKAPKKRSCSLNILLIKLARSSGYSLAEKTYAMLAGKNQHSGWKYFRRFKLELYGRKKVRRSETLTDEQGNKMPAVTVFAAAIKHLKDELLTRVNERVKDTKDTDIFWILTVPAIWEDSAKQFMLEAANKAGIQDDNLMLALEPEAAAIYCKEQAFFKAKEQGTENKLETFGPGAQFMLLDLGGGTVDITVHKVQSDGTLLELYPPTGGPWGGTLVDKYMLKLFDDLFGEDVIQKLRSEYSGDYFELQRKLELKKRDCKPSGEAGDNSVTPPICMYDIYDELKGRKFEDSLRNSETVTVERKKMTFKTGELQSCFNKSVTSLIGHVEVLMQEQQLKNVNFLVMVGGFAESVIVKRAMTDAFGGRMTVILPEQPEIAVVSGAVMFGHRTNLISSRILRFTYGVSTDVPFRTELSHPESNKTFRNGQYMCENVFDIFIQRGTNAIPGKTKIEKTFCAPREGAKQVAVDIYSSTLKQPKYVNTDNSRNIGELEIKLEATKRNEKPKIDVTMWFGDTMLYVEAREHGTDNKVQAKFNFLS